MTAKKEAGRILESRVGNVAMLRLDRPGSKNALGSALREGLKRALLAAEADDFVRVIVLSGTDECFSVGADISELNEPSSWPDLSNEKTVWQVVAARRKPLIAAVEGYALGGGCELVLLADVIVASRKAKFGFPEVLRGLIPGAGGTQRFARAVGPQRALLYQLTGAVFSGETASEMGLVATLVDEGQAFESACEIARKIADVAPLAARELRELVWRGLDGPIEEGLANEVSALQRLRASADFREGCTAFLEKRSPKFSGS